MLRDTTTLLVFALLGTTLIGQDQAHRDIEQALRADFEGKVLLLRNLGGGQQLVFDEEGQLVKGELPGPWTITGMLRLERLRVRQDRLVLEGRRMLLVYNPETDELDDLASIKSGKVASKKRQIQVDTKSKDARNLLDEQRVDIEVRLRSGELTEGRIRSLLSKIYLRSDAELAENLPTYWQPYLSTKRGSPTPFQAVYRVGGGTSAPRRIHTPDPEYSEIARRAKLQGTLVLWMIISETGGVSALRIVQPLGLGLDEKAVEAVRGWKFEPARREGQPVPVQVNVEVDFRLY